MNPIKSFSELTLLAVHAALKAGELIRRGFGTTYTTTSKPGRQNYVTEFDHASEQCIIKLIKESYPSHGILAEESGLTIGKKNSSITWIIDPLDGTTNFSRNIPLFVVSIAAYDAEGPLCGVIYHPLTHELFTAEKGKGAYLNGNLLQVSKTSAFSDVLLGIGLPYDVEDNTIHCIDHLTHFAKQGLTLRNLGSAALNLAYVAAGKFDGMVLNLLYPWDVAAGMLLVHEAGGIVSDFYGTPLDASKPTSVLATNGILHKEMLSQIQSALANK